MKNREQGTGNREQGTGNREQEIGNSISMKRISLSLQRIKIAWSSRLLACVIEYKFKTQAKACYSDLTLFTHQARRRCFLLIFCSLFPVPCSLSLTSCHYSAEHHIQLGLQNQERRQLDAAVLEFRKAVEKTPNSAKAHAHLARVFHQMGKFEAALREYEAAIRLNPDELQVHYDLGAVYHTLGQLDEAKTQYETAIRLNPRFAEAYHNLGAIYQRQGKLDEAVQAYQAALQLQPNNQETKRSLQDALHDQDKQLAYELLRCQTAISLNPKDAESHWKLGMAYYSIGDMEAALETLEIALKLKPDLNLARRDSELVLQKKQEYLKAALSQYLMAVRQQPNNPEIYAALGILYVGKGDWTLAKQAFEIAIQLNPNFANAILHLGNLQQKRGDKKAAESSFQRALQLQSNISEAHLRLGVIQMEAGKLEEAIEHLKRAAQLDLMNPQAHYHLAEAYELTGTLGTLDEAMSQYQMAVRLKPDLVEAYFQLGKLYAQKGNSEAALTFYRKFVDLALHRPSLQKEFEAANNILQRR